MAPKWQPTAVTDFKSVAGKWEGFLTATTPERYASIGQLFIEDTRGCETAITRTITKMPVDYGTIDVFAEKALFVLTDAKLTATFEKGGKMTAQLYVAPPRCVELRVKIAMGSPLRPTSNALEGLPLQNDDTLPHVCQFQVPARDS
jgi:hypothetical protein